MRIKGNEVYITGIGSFSPGDKILFDAIEDVLGKITAAPPKMVKWIEKMKPLMKRMLGMEYFYYAIDPVTGEPTEDNISMSVKSAQKALAMAGVEASEIELILYGGANMEYVICPPTTVLIQDKLNIPYCAEISIHSNCTSVCKALQVGADLIANGRYKNALIMSSQLSSPFLLATHFNQKVLKKEQAILRWFLCDGAGALVLTSQKNSGKMNLRVVDTYLESVGVGLGPDMYASFGGHRFNPLEAFEHGWLHLTQNIQKVSTLAPSLYRQGLKNMMKKIDIDKSKLKYFLVNIPTRHLLDLCIKSIKKEGNIPHLQFYSKLRERGYQGAPAILIALDEFFKEHTLKQGDQLTTLIIESSKWMHGGFLLEYL